MDLSIELPERGDLAQGLPWIDGSPCREAIDQLHWGARSGSGTSVRLGVAVSRQGAVRGERLLRPRRRARLGGLHSAVLGAAP